MTPQFLYFDLGNVVLYFSHQRQAEQVARVAGIDAGSAWKLLYEDGLHWDCERGGLSENQYYGQFCERTGSRPTRNAFDEASNDIFELNVPLVGLLGRLVSAGYPLGILSNTTAGHWRYCTQRYAVLNAIFPVTALSFELGAMKPEAEIYAAAAALAKAPPERIFFTDDRPEHVAGARAAGWDAVPYESVSQINQELRRRGVVTNY